MRLGISGIRHVIIDFVIVCLVDIVIVVIVVGFSIGNTIGQSSLCVIDTGRA
jgi:hypothetical protein